MEPDMAIVAQGDALSIHTGFPNPALDRLGRTQALALDLNQLLIRHPSSTYVFKVRGHQWHDDGIFDGDTAIVDRALKAQPNDLVIAWQSSGFIICRTAKLRPDDAFWGVITATIHSHHAAEPARTRAGN